MYGLDRLDRLIIDLARDNTSGATDLVRKAVEVFTTFAVRHRGGTQQFYGDLVEVGRKVIASQPTMAPMFNCVNDLLVTVKEAPPKDMRRMTAAWGKDYLAELDRARMALVENGSRLIKGGDTVMTYSYSSAVLDLIGSCRDLDIGVVLSEGRPMNEGIDLAEAFGRLGIRTTLVVDAALTSHLEKASLVIVGADAITERGIINKMGTRCLAIAARWYKVPLYVAAERNKFVMSGYFTPRFDEHPAIEVTHRRPHNVTVHNLYFDETPFGLVKGIVTDTGIRQPDETMEYLKGRAISEELLLPLPDEGDVIGAGRKDGKGTKGTGTKGKGKRRRK